ncbi:MAG TPA: MqnA/MqnD/SBP family protein [Candidatus Eisenbacteria bacterium]|jgi:1,4-dihydroxy-6-naphthoate synthase
MTAAPPATLRTLRFGHSPDADDAFMFYGFHAGLASVPGCRVEHVLEDIQSLNRRALERADLEITAVSAHAYAFIADRYAVLSCGASMGMGYGPVVVARAWRAPESLRGARVAVPGRLTTAALLLATECPGSIPVEVRFDRIPDTVAAGEVEAGVIIHESQLTYGDQGLVKVLDFGERWRDRDGLPVPLGLDVVRRDLGMETMRAVSAGFRASIQAALDHEREALGYALGFGRGLDAERGRRFVRMYVNDLTLDMGEVGRAALARLYRRAVEAGAIERAPEIELV